MVLGLAMTTPAYATRSSTSTTVRNKPGHTYAPEDLDPFLLNTFHQLGEMGNCASNAPDICKQVGFCDRGLSFDVRVDCLSDY
jgi:hypothetical protein